MKKKVEIAKTLPDFKVGYFNQTLIGNQIQNGQEIYFGPSNRFQGFLVGVSIPLWFIPNVSKIKATKINTQIANDNFAYHQTNLQGQYLEAVQEYLKNKNSLDYYKSSALPNAALILKQSQLAYYNGEISYAEFLLGAKSANSIKESYLQTLNLYNQSVIVLEYLSGNK